MYSELYTKTNRNLGILKVVGAVVLVVLVSLSIFLYSQDSAPTRASNTALLDKHIINLGPKQFGIFWEVDTADEGWVIYGTSPSKLDNIALDERDSAGEREKRIYHFAMLKNLTPSQTYYFKLISDNAVLSIDSNDLFEAKTLDENTQASSLSPIYGTVAYANGDPAKNVFSMLIVGNAHRVMAVTGSSGEWLIPLQYVINMASRKPVIISDQEPLTLQLFTDTQKSTVRTTLSRSRPIPETTILGNNYSYIADQNVLAVNDERGSDQTTIPRKVAIDVRYPKQNAVIPGTSPLIKGYGVPGYTAVISINTQPVFSRFTSIDAQGEWSVPVKGNFAPGTYTLTFTTRNESGKEIVIKRNFTLIKSGEKVLGETSEATPSVTVVVTTPTPIVSQEVQEVVEVVETPSSETEVVLTPPPPVSGLNIVPYVSAGVGFLIVGLGVLLLL